MDYQVGTASKQSTALPGMVFATAPQLPVPAGQPPANRALYQRMDEVMCALDTSMREASEKVGIKSPIGESHRARGIMAIAAAAALLGVGTGLYASFVGDFGWIGATLTGLVAAFGTGVVSGFVWEKGCNIASSLRARQAPASKDLEGVRNILKRSASATEAAGLGKGAGQWLDTLERRQVHGFDAQELLAELKERATRASPAETTQVARWTALRSSIADCVNTQKLEAQQLHALREAFDALPAEEQRDIAPVVLEKLFRDEAPIHGGWAFHAGFGLHQRLNRIAAGLPVDPVARAKAKKAVEDPGEQAEANAPIEAPAGEPSPSFSVSTQDSSTIASLDGTIEAFETALLPALKLPKKKRSVSPDDVAAAVAIADSAERTPVELVALGARARRFVEELDAREIYGYQARQNLLAIATASEQLAPELRDQIGRIDAYRAAIDGVAPKALNGAGIDRVLSSVDDLLPCDRRMGAQRAYDRYFQNGVPRHRTDYNEGQRFLKGLRAHLKKV